MKRYIQLTEKERYSIELLIQEGYNHKIKSNFSIDKTEYFPHLKFEKDKNRK